MEKDKQRHLKEREPKIAQHIYSRSLLTRKIAIDFNYVGSDLNELLQEYIHDHFEGKCVVEGLIKTGSTKLINYSCGVVEGGNTVIFETMFECEICYPIAGMLIQCTVVDITKAGIRGECAVNGVSPIVVFVAKDHHYNNHMFNSIQIGDSIQIRVIGKRFELNDKYIAVISELVVSKEKEKEKEKEKKARIMIS